MVGLVLVSHSRPLAEGLVDLIRQMTSDEVRIAVAAGTDDGQDLGTDASAVLEAIQQVDGPDGVLVLADIGSALLSVETALEFLGDDERARVRLCPAPLVEGAVAAAVQAGLGSDLDQVYREATTALHQKYTHLDLPAPRTPAASEAPTDEASPSEDEAPSEDGAPEATATVTLPNPHGLHARPAAQVVRAAAQFDARITLASPSRGTGPAAATSLSAVATLGAVQGDTVAIAAWGPDARLAVEALRDLAADGFGERAADAPRQANRPAPDEHTADDDAVQGASVADGYAMAPAVWLHAAAPEVPQMASDNPDSDWGRLRETLEAVREALAHDQADAATSAGPDASAVLEAQALLLDDPALLDHARRRLFDDRVHVARAWLDAVEQAAGGYERLTDTYQRERATDVRDVGYRVARRLVGETGPALALPDEPVVLLADALTPSQASGLDPEAVQGVACMRGGVHGHAALLLRSLGVPAVFAVGDALRDVAEGTLVGLDGAAGRVWIDPDAATAERLREARRQGLERQMALREAAQAPTRTADGQAVAVLANVGVAGDAERAEAHGADGVGLLRTEILLGHHAVAPAEADQQAAFEQVAEALAGRPVVVRTFDAGGDKPLPFLRPDPESNPFLGVRGLRLLLRHPDLLAAHSRALLRAAAHHPLHVMLPMVTTLDELDAARDIFEAAHEELAAQGLDHGWPLPFGIMVETPACALRAEQFAPRVDFFSIGTNDLTQYVMAADRGHPALAALADPLHPAVLTAIAHVVEAARARGVSVSVCGEAAADVLAVPVLLGLGVTTLSVQPTAVPQIKALVRTLTAEAARALATFALDAPDAETVRAQSRALLRDHAPDFVAARS